MQLCSYELCRSPEARVCLVCLRNYRKPSKLSWNKKRSKSSQRWGQAVMENYFVFCLVRSCEDFWFYPEIRSCWDLEQRSDRIPLATGWRIDYREVGRPCRELL